MTITMMIMIVNFMEENIFIEEKFARTTGQKKKILRCQSYQSGPKPDPEHETNYSKITLNHPRPNFDF